MDYKFKIGDLVYRKFHFESEPITRRRNIGIILERKIEGCDILYKVHWFDFNKEYMYSEDNLEILSEAQ